MMLTQSEKIFTVYEKPEAPEPSARMELVREGFAFWAFVFGGLWLISKRLWLPLLAYAAVSITLQLLVNDLGWKSETHALLAFALQLALGLFGHDLEGWNLTRRGYHFAGVLAGNSEIAAEQRYYEHAA